MKTASLLFVCMLLCGSVPVTAETLYVCGDVSGTWNADTVLVTCEVRVPPGDTLVIEPGVKVLFWAYCKFIVDDAAVLHAVGTATDSIVFDEYVLPAIRHENRWNGIRFLSASDSSRLEYCHLKHGLAFGSGENVNGGAIYCSSSSPTIRNCLIDSCDANGDGGGIYCTSASPVIDSTTISGNSAGGSGSGILCTGNSNPAIGGNTLSGNSSGVNGGGIWCDNSSPTISGNTISGNSTTYGAGGGIGCFSSNPTISGNSISGNSSSSMSGPGGGIYCGGNSNPTISGNTISGNSAGPFGGGISCYVNSNPTISGNTLSGNVAGQGGGISCGSNSNSTIIGNTISGNSAWGGGGIHCDDNSSPEISGNTLSENSSSWYGGGIYCTNSGPTISGNTITGNSSSNGGGICCTSSIPTVINNKLSGNTASTGGGIYCEAGSNLVIDLNEISQNTAAGDGGGIYLSASSPTMNKNTIVENTAATGGGLFSYNSDPVLRTCILWGNNPHQQIRQVYASNVQVTYSDILTFWPGVGNITADPMFVDSANADYHLRAGSPCIDTGDPDPIYDDPDGSRADQGCYYHYLEDWTASTVLVAWVRDDSLRLAWRPLLSALTYNVYWADSLASSSWFLLTNTPDTVAVDPIGVAERRTYQVRALR
jgi:parallel beta-helix repeat protein